MVGLLEEYQDVSYAERMARTVDVGKQCARGDASARQQLEQAFRVQGYNGVLLALQACYGSRDGDAVLRCWRSPYNTSLRSKFLKIVPVVCNDQQVHEIWKDLSNSEKKAICHGLHHQKRSDLVDHLVREIARIQTLDDALAMLHFCSTPVIEELWSKYGSIPVASYWKSVGLSHPLFLAQQLEHQICLWTRLSEGSATDTELQTVKAAYEARTYNQVPDIFALLVKAADLILSNVCRELPDAALSIFKLLVPKHTTKLWCKALLAARPHQVADHLLSNKTQLQATDYTPLLKFARKLTSDRLLRLYVLLGAKGKPLLKNLPRVIRANVVKDSQQVFEETQQKLKSCSVKLGGDTKHALTRVLHAHDNEVLSLESTILPLVGAETQQYLIRKHHDTWAHKLSSSDKKVETAEVKVLPACLLRQSPKQAVIAAMLTTISHPEVQAQRADEQYRCVEEYLDLLEPEHGAELAPLREELLDLYILLEENAERLLKKLPQDLATDLVSRSQQMFTEVWARLELVKPNMGPSAGSQLTALLDQHKGYVAKLEKAVLPHVSPHMRHLLIRKHLGEWKQDLPGLYNTVIVNQLGDKEPQPFKMLPADLLRQLPEEDVIAEVRQLMSHQLLVVAQPEVKYSSYRFIIDYLVLLPWEHLEEQLSEHWNHKSVDVRRDTLCIAIQSLKHHPTSAAKVMRLLHRHRKETAPVRVKLMNELRDQYRKVPPQDCKGLEGFIGATISAMDTDGAVLQALAWLLKNLLYRNPLWAAHQIQQLLPACSRVSVSDWLLAKPEEPTDQQFKDDFASAVLLLTDCLLHHPAFTATGTRNAHHELSSWKKLFANYSKIPGVQSRLDEKIAAFQKSSALRLKGEANKKAALEDVLFAHNCMPMATSKGGRGALISTLDDAIWDDSIPADILLRPSDSGPNLYDDTYRFLVDYVLQHRQQCVGPYLQRLLLIIQETGSSKGTLADAAEKLSLLFTSRHCKLYSWAASDQVLLSQLVEAILSPEEGANNHHATELVGRLSLLPVRPVDVVLKLNKNTSNAKVKMATTAALGEMLEQEEAVARLLECLEDPELTKTALPALTKWLQAQSDQQQLTTLRSFLSKRVSVANAALLMLGQLSTTYRPALDELLVQCQREDLHPSLALQLLATLSKFQLEAPETWPFVLRAASGSKDIAVQAAIDPSSYMTACSVTELQESTKRHLRAVYCALLDSSDQSVRLNALEKWRSHVRRIDDPDLVVVHKLMALKKSTADLEDDPAGEYEEVTSALQSTVLV